MEHLRVGRRVVRAILLAAICASAMCYAAPLAAAPVSRPMPGKVRMVLPSVIYGVVGIEMNVYFDNVALMLNPDNYAFDVTCGKGIQQAERWTFLPKTEDIGEVPFQLVVRDQDNAIVARAQSVIRIMPPDAGAGQDVTLLCVGDSLTYQAVYVQHFVDLCQGPGNPRLHLIGTMQGEGAAATTLLEGAPGQTTKWFATQYSTDARKGEWQLRAGSPFMYLDANNRPTLDYARYCQETNQGKAPDIVTFFLGINDVFPLTDATLAADIENKIIRPYESLIAMVHAVNRETKIGVVLIPPPAASQDAFGTNCGCAFDRWQYKRNQHQLVERLIKHFGGREKERIFLLPVYLNLDCRHNYPVNGTAWNARNTTGRAMQVNAVHPAVEGYRQNGDSFYFWLKTVTALSTVPLRFETLDNTVAGDGLVRLRHEYRQDRDLPLVFEAEAATDLEFQSADKRIMSDAQASGGFYIDYVKKLEFDYTVETPGTYQVRLRAWFPLKAPYTHKECMDNGPVQTVDDSQLHDPGVWFWTTGATYELGRGLHHYAFPSPTAFCAGARLDKVAILPVDRSDVNDFGPVASPIVTPLTGQAVTERISLRLIKAWQLNYTATLNGGNATVEYTYDREKWLPAPSGEFSDVPQPKPQFIYFRFILTGKAEQPSPWIQGVELQVQEEFNL